MVLFLKRQTDGKVLNRKEIQYTVRNGVIRVSKEHMEVKRKDPSPNGWIGARN